MPTQIADGEGVVSDRAHDTSAACGEVVFARGGHNAQGERA
jgi:hypothetical protein